MNELPKILPSSPFPVIVINIKFININSSIGIVIISIISVHFLRSIMELILQDLASLHVVTIEPITYLYSETTLYSQQLIINDQSHGRLLFFGMPFFKEAKSSAKWKAETPSVQTINATRMQKPVVSSVRHPMNKLL